MDEERYVYEWQGELMISDFRFQILERRRAVRGCAEGAVGTPRRGVQGRRGNTIWQGFPGETRLPGRRGAASLPGAVRRSRCT